MGSTRLPGKVLMKINNKPLLQFMIERVSLSKLVDKIIIATTIESKDDPIEEFCTENNLNVYRGSEDDVLDRYYQAAKLHNPKTVIRLTADCPLCDPEIIDQTIKLFQDKSVDYAANTCPPEEKKYPDGSDVEVFSFEALKRAWKETKDPKDREHVTFYLWKRGKNFSTALLDNKHNWGEYRITIDYKEDFLVIEKILQKLQNENKFGTIKEIVEVLQNNKEIMKLNSGYTWGMNW